MEINNTELELPIKYQRVKLNCDWYCKLKGINRATYFRWKKSIIDKRKDTPHSNLPKYTKEHEDKVLSWAKRNPDLNVDELIATALDLKDENGNSCGFYLGSRSYVYRLLRKARLINSKRSTGKGNRHNFNKKKLVATKPNQVYVWDITYLYSSIEGEYFYMYAMMDLYSRKMIHYEVHKEQKDTIAASFLENALRRERIAIKGHVCKFSEVKDDIVVQNGLILHSDNGSPMKGKNMLFAMISLGITASYSRPRHSNDNAHMESSFATLKHSHSLRIPKYFETVKQAQSWADKFYNWYNNRHLHSGLKFITPNDCHNGKAEEIFRIRNEIIEQSIFPKNKPYKLAKRVSLMSFSTRRKKFEQATKEAEYADIKLAA